MRKQTNRIFSILLTLVMLLSLLPGAAQAAELIGRDTISSVAITVGRPIAGEPLAACVPETTLCQITCTWAVRGPKDVKEIPAATIAEAETTYILAMVLTPKLDLYTFADSVTGTVNGKTVTVDRASSTKAACTAILTPMTRETEVAVSVAPPAVGATPGTPTADGHAVSDVSWWRGTSSGILDGVELAEDEVFSKSYNYWMEATVTAGSNSLFGDSTAVTVNGKPTTILSRDLEANTITFRYYVGSEELLTVAGNVYVANGSGGSWYLTHGDTKTNAAGTYSASYQNGILTLTNTGGSTIGGACQVPNQSWYAGIYADGDLTVHFDGDFHFDLSGTPETASFVYGIYAVGDLTLVNQSDDDCTVSFSPAEGVLATHGSSGIYCETGSLTVENKGNGDFTLNADAVGVRPVDGAVKDNFTNNGIYAAGSITIGDDCTVNATAADVELSSWGTTTSRGIYCDRDLTIGENAVVTAAGGNINPSQSATNLNLGNYQYCCGVYIRAGGITVNGGTLIVTGGNIDYGTITGAGNMGLGQECYGIYCNDSITLNGGTITARAGYSRANAFIESSLSEGIYCSHLTVSSGTLTATADDAWLESTGLWVQNDLSQTGGTITGTGGVAVCINDTGDGSRGIYVVDTLTASGGTLTATGGTIGRTVSSVGLQAGKIELRGTAQVTGYGGLTTTDPVETPVAGESSFAGYPGDSIGVWTFDDLTVDGNAVLTATGGTVRGNDSSPAKAMSIGLNIITADDCTISGSGKIVATGGETHYGGKGNNYYDSSHGIYGEILSLTIDGTTVIATGGSVSTKTDGGNGTKKGGASYGLYLPGSSLTLEEGAELTATGGDNPTYSDNYTQKSQINNSYGAYVGGDITVTDSVLTATGGLSIRTVGLYNGGTVTLNGLNSRLTATADEYYEDAPGAGSEQYCYGAMNGDGYNPGGAYTVNGGVLLLQGQELAMSYRTNSTLTAATIWCSYDWDGSNPATHKGSAELSSFYSRKYVKADSSSVNVTINSWTYGDSGWDPSYTAYEGDPEILWTGTTRADEAYSSTTNAPTEAGSYTVTVTYPGGQTGSADFTVAPRSINNLIMTVSPDFFRYNGEPQTMGVTVTYKEDPLVEGTDYTVTGNTQTNAGQYTVTANGIGNFTGTKEYPSFYITKRVPYAEDFDIPAIGTYTYTGEAVELPLPTLKEPMTGIGEIQLGYYRYSGATLIPATPRDAGEYEVKFQVFAGDNFLEDGYTNGIDYGTLVIQKGANPMTLLHDSITLPRGGSIDIGKFVTNAADSNGALDFEIVGDGDCADASSLSGSTLTVGNVTGEFQVRITADGSNNYSAGEVLLTVTVAETVPPGISGTFTAQGTSAVTRVQVENYFYGDKALLLIVQYSADQQMTAIQSVSVTNSGTVTPDSAFTHKTGCTYKAFLVNADTYAPLCAAAPLSAE